MNFQPVRIILLCMATTLFPVALLGQAEPGGLPEGAAQSSGQQPAQSNEPAAGPGQRQPSRPSMQDSMGSSGQTAQAAKDKMFVRKAIEGGLAQVQFGQLAAQKGGSDDVKALGRQMVEDHTALNENLKAVGDSMGVMVPKHISKEDQAELDKLNGLSGDAFDTEYLTMMVKEHHHDLRGFRVEAVGTQDAALREAVEKGAQTIHEHLVKVDELAKSKGIEVPHRHHENGGEEAPPPPPPAQ
jgi:putative membrane protein